MKDAQSASPLYLKLFAETAQIEWSELQRFFARGVLLKVARDIDLVSVAEAVANDDTKQVTAWLSAGLLERGEDPAAGRADQRQRPPKEESLRHESPIPHEADPVRARYPGNAYPHISR